MDDSTFSDLVPKALMASLLVGAPPEKWTPDKGKKAVVEVKLPIEAVSSFLRSIEKMQGAGILDPSADPVDILEVIVLTALVDGLVAAGKEVQKCLMKSED